jgi:metallo-beta-lactamase family protein
MTITARFLGAAQEVTGSMHLLETPGGKLLVDCGLFQGRREESRRRNTELPREAVAADAVLLTHAHIDHSGSLPTLVKRGFRGTIWATPATRDLCSYLLRDSARIQEGDAEYLNRKNADDPSWTPIHPLYDEGDADRALGRFRDAAYGAPFEPLPGVTARFLDAGHILGSAQIVLDIKTAAGSTRVVLSGDLGRRGLPILRDPADPGHADWLFMESTYGNRAHAPIGEMHDKLAKVVNETVAQKGKVIVPAFAVGRTQELVYALHYLYSKKRIPEVPIFVDSPLSVNVTDVFKCHPDCYDDETRAFLDTVGDPFTFSTLRYIESREQSMRLNDMAGPFIVISSSGMCEAGRVLHHLKNGVDDPRNTVLIVGFQAQHTLGRRLVERRPRVRILGVERELHARVVVMNALSAHGDRDDLLEYAGKVKPRRGVFLIHGEPDQQGPLVDTLRGRGVEVSAPAAGESAALD